MQHVDKPKSAGNVSCFYWIAFEAELVSKTDSCMRDDGEF